MSYWAAIAACVMLAGLGVFQAALAAGTPWGHLAWGGKSRELPWLLRGASFLTILLYGIAGAIVVQRAGLATVLPPAMVDIGIWVVVGVLVLGVAANAISRSLPEKLAMTPVTAVLLILVLIVAFGL
ncbi:MAG TPA: hypothetical protein VG757_14925 [Devosia sp.]|nr:hypothetical protein [Devosia sp.]